MYRLLLIMVAVLVAVIQIAVWTAAERRSDFAARLAQRGRTTTATVTAADGKIVDGRSQYVVDYEFQLDSRTLSGEESLSLRQPDLPKKGSSIQVYYDPEHPEMSTIQNPEISMQRLATMKLLTLGFGVFTYAFLWITWVSHKNELKEQQQGVSDTSKQSR